VGNNREFWERMKVVENIEDSTWNCGNLGNFGKYEL
jgi:hypothetical protein